MIINDVQIHDKYNVEVKLNYRTVKQKKSTSYKINTYFFIPNNLDINRSTYSKEEFYSDLKTYIRFQTPVYLMRDIVKEQGSPLEKLKNSLQVLAVNPNLNNFTTYRYFVKIFCTIAQSSIRDAVNHIEENEINKTNFYLVDDFIKDLKLIVHKFRDLEFIINVPTVSENYFSIFQVGDEYLSNIAEIYYFELLTILKRYKLANYPELKTDVLNLIRDEIEYRKEKGFETIPSDKEINDTLLYRRSVLKKFIDDKLFLNTRASKDGNLAEQFILTTSAGLAMLVASIISFFSKMKFGDFTLQFFLIIILGYMLKDRIKELLRMYFNQKIRRFFFDHKKKIYNDNGKIIGVTKESFDFVQETKLDPQVLKVRKRDYFTDLDNGWQKEKILLYRKHINIYEKKLRMRYRDLDFNGIVDITRFNVERFIKKMDDPVKLLYVLKDGDFAKKYGDRLYHINMVIRYEINEKLNYQRYRIILNRSGIKRIELVEDS